MSETRGLGLILVFLLFASFTPSTSANAGIDKELVSRFLKSQYIVEIGLLRAAVKAYPDNITAYVANDNLLAAHALIALGEYELADKILSKLMEEFKGGYNGRVEVLLGVDIPDQFYRPRVEIIEEVNGYRVVYEKTGDEVIEDWYEYSDLLVYRILDQLNSGSMKDVGEMLVNLTKMWDGTGFRDKSFNGYYSTYKCSLFIFLYRTLELVDVNLSRQYDHVRNRCMEVIASAQNRDNGGIHTEYRVEDGSIIVDGDVNVETTSITVLALYSNYPWIIAGRIRSMQDLLDVREWILIAIIVTSAVITILAVFKFLTRSF